MTVLPSIRGKDLVAALKKAGFQVVRIKGSHHFRGIKTGEPQ